MLDKRTGQLVAQDDEKIGTPLFPRAMVLPSLGKVGGRTLVFFGGGDGVCYAFEALRSVPEQAVPLKKAWSFRLQSAGVSVPQRQAGRNTATATAASIAAITTTAVTWGPARSSPRRCSTAIASTWRSAKTRSTAADGEC